MEHSVGHIAERQIECRGCRDDGTAVRESLEARAAVVGAHARVADAAEGQSVVGDVHYRVVDAGAARRCLADDFASCGRLSKVV